MRNTRCSLVSVDSLCSLSPFGLLAASGLVLAAIGCSPDDAESGSLSGGTTSAASDSGGAGTGGTGTSTGGTGTSTGGSGTSTGGSVSTGGSGVGGGPTTGGSGGSGGTTDATGGTTDATGGTTDATGGTTDATGGTGTGGTTVATGGTDPGTGGTTGVTGGQGGTTATGGTSGETGGAATAGSSGSTEVAGAGGGSDVPTLVEPIARSGGAYVLEFGDIYFEVDSDVGARIVKFSLDGTEVLSPVSRVASSSDANMKNNYGSTFWTSPQASWDWPPVTEIDSDAYGEVSVDATSFTLESDAATLVNSGDRISITKRFTAELAENRIRVDYTMHNEGSSAAALAPWEIARVTSGGLTFFPTGPGGTRAPANGMTELDLTESSGIAWLDWTGSGPSGEAKYIGDGAEGWLAHALDGVLLLRTFADIAISDAASGEADVELYTNVQYDYAELEPQGAMVTIPANGETTWTVYWQLVAIPTDVQVEEGSATLVTFARSTAELAPVSGT